MANSRKAEDGPIPERYPLQEIDSTSYPVRTEMNVRDSDGTLILTWDRPTGGTALTIHLARRHGKPCLVVDLKNPADPSSLRAWLEKNGIGVLNVAGPRESKNPGISQKAVDFRNSLVPISPGDHQALSLNYYTGPPEPSSCPQ
jgi:hypothetical protein